MEQDGVILTFGPLGPLMRQTVNGEVSPATSLDGDQTNHWFPNFLPGGRRFLFFVSAAGIPAKSAIYLGELDTKTTTRVIGDVPQGSTGMYVTPGWLLYVQDRSLLARKFDLRTANVAGEAVRVASGVSPSQYGPGVSVSTTGVIAYRTSGVASKLTWFTRSGNVLGTIGPADDNELAEPALSPDDRAVLVTRTVKDSMNVWRVDDVNSTRVTFEREAWGVWSSDRRWIVFSSGKSGFVNMHIKPAASAGSSEEKVLLASATNEVATSWSPDGRVLLYNTVDEHGSIHISVLPMEGDRPGTPSPWLRTQFGERHAQFSPDGRFVAYQSDVSGRDEIYVRPFAFGNPSPGDGRDREPPGPLWKISTAGGVSPRWKKSDGSELYYVAPDGTLMAAAIKQVGGALQIGMPVALFHPRIKGGGTPSSINWNYDVSRDGRFLVNVDTSPTPPIIILQNWQAPSSE